MLVTLGPVIGTCHYGREYLNVLAPVLLATTARPRKITDRPRKKNEINLIRRSAGMRRKTKDELDPLRTWGSPNPLCGKSSLNRNFQLFR